jgi:microcystin-dependent protein
MPYNGSGVFSILNSFVPNTTITSSASNANNSDIAAGLSNALTRDGQAGMTAALSLGSHLINNVTDPSSPQDAATKNYVDTVSATQWSTGDIKLTLKTVADSGWVMFTDGTIGDASSNATVASAATSALFTLLYNSPFVDATCPLFTSTGTPTTRGAQGTAAAAYAAHCRISTPALLGRAMAMAGGGSGLTGRNLGSTIGTETTTLAQANLPSVNFNVTDPGHTHVHNTPAAGGAVVQTGAGTGVTGLTAGTINTATTGISVGSGGSGTAVSNMQPSTFLNAMVKL